MLSNKIREYRKIFNWSQEQLAVRVGASKQNISNWENDNYDPSIPMLAELARVFGVTTDKLLELDDRRYIETTGLTDEQIADVTRIVCHMKSARLSPAKMR